MAVINYLTTVHIDFGAIRMLGAELQRLGIQRPLIVTDRGIRAAGIADKVLDALGPDCSPTVFEDTPPNPTEAAVSAATGLYLGNGCDGIVAVGGGSPIDLGKATALLATHPAPLQTYAAVEGGASRITSRAAPLVAIPTTAGTGSEVGRGAVIVMESGRKLGLLSPFLLPKLAICDPELTRGLPPALTAATGMDAIAHCIETFLSPAINPPAEAIALDGLRRGLANIGKATADGCDRDARWNMMMAAMEGALAFQKGLGAVHALSHPLGAVPGVSLHHGTLNAVLLPAVLRFNKPATQAKQAALVQAMGLPAGGNPAQAISELNARLGLPAGLGVMGVPRDVLEDIAVAATKDHCHATNPRTATVDDYLAMLQESY
ncbi:4-hydroxybutyrate dehydrogenase [Cupriavidus taiwanensis]|uniref:iron-containing alcohol dehydrogenase n=1 Tax=Cupriavidus taiwanensis TaxID=164546 RepID=UPI000E16C4D6|nr:iron-containing alcohol dehydrogenase [Cupriavidus taiwanensis]SOZ14249.1 4-hydroxybutyrate dehydrogenase [Cupriavidus taiwanensis]SOZ25613.1 4-hydroxybutyrate dehydrogenase [Cupriavidus taiwanensis]SOZ44862.1 4-hydroxybutyrate dehydrogenase [Cupriavidus taiwanensis]